MFKLRFKKIFASISLSVVSLSNAAAMDVTLKVALENDTVLLGKTVNYEYFIENPENLQGYIQMMDSIPQNIDMKEIFDNKKSSYLIQPFDTGTIMLPSMMFITATDTFYSNRPTLFVQSPDVAELIKAGAINDADDVKDLPSKWYDFLPDFLTDAFAKYWIWIIIGLVIIGGGICAYLILTKRITVPFLTKKTEPPYDVAIRQLNELKEQRVWEKGLNKEYYTRLTDILRTYIDGRFAINAREMTTPQLLEAFNSNPELTPFYDSMHTLLEVSDFVKFAKSEPTPDENIRAFNITYDFVEETKPIDTDEDRKAENEPEK